MSERVKVWVCSVETLDSPTTAFVAASEQQMLDTLREQWGERGEVDAKDVADADLIQWLCDDGCIIFTDVQEVEVGPRESWPTNDAEREVYAFWQHEVAGGDTILGFRAWVTHQLENP